MSKPLEIAIIGVAGAYAGAGTAQRYWQNILDKVDAVEDAGPEWASLFADPNARSNDRTYTTRGGFLKEHAEVDLFELGVMPNTLDGGEPDHMLALRFARDALIDAGYWKTEKPFDREKVGVVIGRGTYTNRGSITMIQHTMVIDQTMELVKGLRPDFDEDDLAKLKAQLKKQLPPYTAEMVALLTPNVIAGLIANRLDMMGPSYIVDAACASTLVAVELAARELESGRCDMVLTGGVQAQTPPQLFVQFSQLNALSKGQLRPFQKGSSGTLLGEGVGLILLKRLADAERDGDRIYAVIQGIGTASDGKAKGLLTPRTDGEILAVRRAYESSGIDPMTIGLIEAHGTGTPVGDKTEIESLSAIFGARVGELPGIALGSVKSMISHCLPASGSASIIKTALALYHKILPPMLCDEVDPELKLEQTPFYINTEARPWIHGGPHPRRAGVNAFGFGGINAHIILEEYRPRDRERPSLAATPLLHTPERSELFTLAAGSAADLVTLARRLIAHAEAPGQPSLAMLAAASSRKAEGTHRLALVAQDVADLCAKLQQAIGKLEKPNAAAFKMRSGVFYGHGAAPGKLCFVFPSEGSQYPNMLGDLCLHFPLVRDWFDFVEETAVRAGSKPRAPVLFPAPTAIGEALRGKLGDQLFEMDVAAETMFAASMALYDLLSSAGIRADVMLGHSTGENAALTAAGVRRYSQREEIAETIRELGRTYRELDLDGRIVEGSLLTIGALRPAPRAALLAEIARPESRIHLANDNCPNQLLVFGSRFDIGELSQRLSAEGAICAELPFGRAYHTPLFRPVTDAYLEYYRTMRFGRGHTPLYSATLVGPFPDGDDEIREVAARQLERPVRFSDTVSRLYEDGVRVFVEVGPSGTLTSFVSDTLRGKDDVLALASNSRRKPGITQLHQTLGQLFAAGIAMQPAALYAHREIAALDLDGALLPAPKPKQRIKLTLPMIELPEEFRRRPLPLAEAVSPRVAEARTTTTSEAIAAQADAPRASAVEPPARTEIGAGAAGSDPRLTALQNHFALMQEFLDSQARVLGVSDPEQPDPEAAPPPAASTNPSQPDPQAFPLLGRVVERSAERLVCERSYDLANDWFLRDHAIGAAPSARQPDLLALTVIPFTFSIEILAEAACLLTDDRLQVIAVDHSRGHRWLGLDEGRLPIRIVAERLAPTVVGVERVQVRMYQLNAGPPGIGLIVFEGVVELAAQFPAAPAARPWNGAQAYAPRHTPAGELYRHGMFHGPRLQGVSGLRRWGEQAIEADMLTIATDDYFAHTKAPRFRTDPAMVDAVGQLAGYWLTEVTGEGAYCFPYHVGRYEQFQAPRAAGTRMVCRGVMRTTEDRRLIAGFDLLDEAGRLVARADDWEDRLFQAPPRLHALRMAPQSHFLSEPWLVEQWSASGLVSRRLAPLDDGFLETGGGFWNRILANLVLSLEERAHFYRALPAAGPRRGEWLMGRIAAKDAVREWAQKKLGLALAPADISVLPGTRGEPLVTAVLGLPPGIALPAVSISHSQGWIVALCGDAGLKLGADYQLLARVDAEALLSGAFSPAEAQRHVRGLPGPEQARAAAALWSAKEAASKAAGSGLEARPQDWEIVAADLAGGPGRRPSATVRHGNADYVVELGLGDDAVFALCRTHAGLETTTATARA